MRSINKKANEHNASREAEIKLEKVLRNFEFREFCALPAYKRALLSALLDSLSFEENQMKAGARQKMSEVMGKHEKAIRIFFDWAYMGLHMPDAELAYECCQDAEVPETVKSEVTDAIDDVLKALIKLRHLNQQAIQKQLKRQKVVDIQEWKNNHIPKASVPAF